jgi:hypothetical protein
MICILVPAVGDLGCSSEEDGMHWKSEDGALETQLSKLTRQIRKLYSVLFRMDTNISVPLWMLGNKMYQALSNSLLPIY